MPEPEQRPMKCDCGSERISTERDVGSDIDPDGEERQHKDTCLDCGLTRIWAERYEDFTTLRIWWGKWAKDFPDSF